MARIRDIFDHLDALLARQIDAVHEVVLAYTTQEDQRRLRALARYDAGRESIRRFVQASMLALPRALGQLPGSGDSKELLDKLTASVRAEAVGHGVEVPSEAGSFTGTLMDFFMAVPVLELSRESGPEGSRGKLEVLEGFQAEVKQLWEARKGLAEVAELLRPRRREGPEELLTAEGESGPPEHDAEDASSDGGREAERTRTAASGASKAKGRSTAARRGRRVQYDAGKDRQLADAFRSSSFDRYEDFARAKGLSEEEVRKAVDRHRKRQNKSRG